MFIVCNQMTDYNLQIFAWFPDTTEGAQLCDDRSHLNIWRIYFFKDWKKLHHALALIIAPVHFLLRVPKLGHYLLVRRAR